MMLSREQLARIVASAPLTQDEVNALKGGTTVLVTWGGGNGPWKYTVKRWYDRIVAATDFEVEHGIIDPDKSLTRCGRYPLTQVWLAD